MHEVGIPKTGMGTASRRPPTATVVAILALFVGACTPLPPTATSNANRAAPSASSMAEASPAADNAQAREEDEGVDQRIPDTALSGSMQVYAGEVSVVAGELLDVHASTTARTFGVDVWRQGWYGGAGQLLIARLGPIPGVDQRRLVRTDPVTHVVRANWRTSAEIDTTGWQPGVYMLEADDSDHSTGYAPFVVRTAVIDRSVPLFVFTAMTYQAYNSWGGFSLYTRPEATRVSFDRPSDLDGGRGPFDRADARLLRWLDRIGLAVQYTTDYDLSVGPPDVAPTVLILPMHTEYVPATLRGWLDEHVNQAGDMNIALFGANSVYWQARLEPGADTSAPLEIVCYKHWAPDPISALAPALTTTRWRDAPVRQPEGTIFGSQYVAKLGNGRTSHYDDVITAEMPTDLLAGTGWQPGARLLGLLGGEGDAIYPGSGAIEVMVGDGQDTRFQPIKTSVVVRVSPAGARVFSAGSFDWSSGFDAADLHVDIGVSAESFDRFNRNVLAWLGLSVGP